MGGLVYGLDGYRIDMDDRVLAHIQVVIIAKLRRGESFGFTWSTNSTEGSGRTTLWLAPAIPVRFEYAGGRPPRINRRWLELLSATAATPYGLRLLAEPEPPPDDSAEL